MGLHTLVNWSAAVAANTAGQILGAPVDQAVGTQNGAYQAPARLWLNAAAGFVSDATRVQLQVPSQRMLGYPYVDPLNPSPPAVNRPALLTYNNNGPAVDASEEIRFVADRLGSAAANLAVVSWWRDTSTPAPTSGNITTVRATTTIVAQPGNWGIGTMLLDTQLNVGNWDVVGIQTYGVGVLASRLVFFNSQLRPGNLGRESQTTWNGKDFRWGNAGVLGNFTNYTFPQLEVFAHTATTTQVTYLDLIKR